MNAVAGEVDAPEFTDAEMGGLLEQETEVLITVAKNNDTKTRPGGAFFPYLNNTTYESYELDEYGVFKTVDRNNYKHNCL